MPEETEPFTGAENMHYTIENPPAMIRAESPRQIAELVVDMLRRNGVPVSNEAVPHIERQIADELRKIEAAGIVTRQVERQLAPILGRLQRQVDHIAAAGLVGVGRG